MKEKMIIDPEKFAYTAISNYDIASEDDELISKKMLSRYLTAYYLITKFNDLEEKQIDISKTNDIKKILTMLGTNNY
ncbi:hypothetical protein [Pseudolactococcus paracarnosus]|uniref:Uncharacterized protein n=1 Tax=Pseudolactococcus paracarnosus TaxID=2749962 RepID=A0A7L4WB04_9LACT|nr:hypothetical protein [Lactococcus paracarnosus]SPC36778.1 conserved hypothetical protein [Lactococcus piscium]MCJ1977451.1 hypothetical protein [Lactococcus paracarnosus]MCJ1983594.1 hypothetical protein [Lactococcus paracarnosus]MCJ1994103.1 hypothetical protein [Lactococcus paracarnosus]MCJ1997790.1 hypothetical protein [Lactococcus paracarnosus]